MIAKLRSKKSLVHTIVYNVREGSQFIGAFNLQGDCIEDYKIQMKDTQNCFKGRAEKITLHAYLSPSIEDGQRLSFDDWLLIAQKYLNGMGLEKHQCIAFLHKDKEHYHMHLVINRINTTNYKVWYSKENDLKLSHRVGHQIANELGLQSAKEVMNTNRSKSNKKIQKPIGAKQKMAFDLKLVAFLSVDQYLTELTNHGFHVKKYFDPHGNVRGYGVEKYGTFLNASKIGKQFTLRELIRNNESVNLIRVDAEGNKTLKPVTQSIIYVFANELREIKFIDTSSYFRELEQKGFKVTIHRDKATNAIRGYGVEKNGIFINASEIGKEFTLKSLLIESTKRKESIKPINRIQTIL